MNKKANKIPKIGDDRLDWKHLRCREVVKSSQDFALSVVDGKGTRQIL